jgi:hypothetical protein
LNPDGLQRGFARRASAARSLLAARLWLAAGLGLAGGGCALGDLGLAEKRCAADRPCPAGLVCVQTPLSPDERIGRCRAPDTIEGCDPGAFRCGGQGSWVEQCAADGISHQVVARCNGEQRCNADIGACSAPCARESDCGAGATCDLGTGLCRPWPDCSPQSCPPPALCIGPACVPAPAAAPVVPEEPPAADIDCLLDAPSQPPASPERCAVTGRVNLFPAPGTSDRTIGLQVVLRAAEAPHQELARVPVVADAGGYGVYALTEVETNRRYVLEVTGEESLTEVEVVPTAHAGFALRADGCVDGTFTRGLFAVPADVYETFTSGTIAGLGPQRGLIIGRTPDCTPGAAQPMAHITVGLAIAPPAPGRVYYFAAESFLLPDLELAATSLKGYYAAAGVPATRNAIGFAMRQGETTLAAGRLEISLRPGMAVIADLPRPGELLPE